jgi:hypothetical protein
VTGLRFLFCFTVLSAGFPGLPGKARVRVFPGRKFLSKNRIKEKTTKRKTPHFIL